MRRINATIQIGAAIASSVGSAFNAMRGKLDGLGSAVTAIKKKSKDLDAFGKSLARVAKAQANLSAAKASGDARRISLATAALQRENQALATLQARLSAAGVNTARFAQEQARLARELAGAESRLGRFTRLSGAVNKVGEAFGKVRERVSGLKGALAAIGLSLGAGGYFFKTQFIDTAAAFEKYNIQLAAFGDNAEKALNWSQMFAEKTPLNLDEVTRLFVRLRQQGLDPTDGTLQALTDSIFKVGGEFYDLEEVINQLGQAFRKQKLTAEDVKPLINRGIPVYEMLAKSMKKTGETTQAATKRIVELQSEGKLGVKEIRALIFELGKWSQGMSSKMAGTWTGILGRMGDYWLKFKKLVMDSGPFEYMKTQLEAILHEVEAMARSGELQIWAEKTGAALVKFLQDFGKFVEKTFNAVSAVAAFVGGWENFAKIIAVLPFTGLIASVISLTAAMVNLAIASWAAIGPWGLLVVAALAAIAAVIYYRKELRAFMDSLGPVGKVMMALILGPIGLMIVYWDKVTAAIQRVKKELTELFSMEGLKGMGSGFLDALTFPGFSDMIPDDVFGKKAPKGAIDFQGGVRRLVPPSQMPSNRPQTNNNVRNEFNVRIDAPGANGESLAEEFTSKIKKLFLGDTTTLLVPQ